LISLSLADKLLKPRASIRFSKTFDIKLFELPIIVRQTLESISAS